MRSTMLRATAVAGALLSLFASAGSAQTVNIPEGFTPLFDGKTLKGWHWSLTNHHGSTGKATVEDGALTLRQYPYGQGGLFVTDRKYENFELSLEVKAPFGCNSGVFFRSTESGSAYQIELLPGTGATGDLLGELMRVSLAPKATELPSVWKDDEFNLMRLRVEGDAPHITLWVNGKQMWDVQEPINDKIAGETSGVIGLQLHWSVAYEPTGGSMGPGASKPEKAYQFRNIAIREIR